MSKLLLNFLEMNEEQLLIVLLSDDFFLGFEALIEMGVFGSKRHDQKISYIDAKRTREILLGNYEKQGLLRCIFI